MKAYHTLVTGSSGGGKTTLLREMHDNFRGVSIFLTPKDNESNVAGKRVRGRRAMDTAVKSSSSFGNVRIKWYGASYPEATEVARSFAHDIYDYSGYPTQIIVDECQQSDLPNSKGALKDGLHEDRDRAIKWVPATQSPQDLKEDRGYRGINQCRWITWVGPGKTFHKGFVNHYNIGSLLPTEAYHYHVIEPSMPPKVVHRGQTKERYG